MKQHIRIRSTQLAAAALLVISAACGNRDDSTAPTGNGTIVLTLTSPNGSTPSVVVTGPNGFSRTVSGTSTLEHLEAGNYTISADSIVTQSTIVGYSVDTAVVTGNPIVVTSSGSSTASVTYAFARQHGALWVGSYSSENLSGFARSQLLTSSALPAANHISSLAASNGVAFGPNGDMWVAAPFTDTLKMFTVAQRNSGNAAVTPARILVNEMGYANGMSFDSHGNLWVASEKLGLLQFSAAQLAAGGVVATPAITLTDTVTQPYSGSFDVEFDAAGNAWVGESYYSNVIEYTVSQLAESGTPLPHVRLGVNPGGAARVVGAGKGTVSALTASKVAFGRNPFPSFLNDPDALAFDASGKLWVANYYNKNLVAYSTTQIATSGNPLPSITIAIPDAYPFGLAFDKEGALWVADDSTYNVRKYTAAQLAASGAPAPSVFLSGGSIEDPEQLAFDEWVVPNTSILTGSRVPYARSVTTSRASPHKSKRHR